MIRYSIVIIVKDDLGIKNSLEKLEPLIRNTSFVEVIVIDASSPKVLMQINERYSYVRWIYYHNRTNKRITIPEQRNLGIKKAKGEVIIFLDANCIPSDNWLKTIELSFSDETIDAITGPILSVGGRTTHDAGYEIFEDGQSLPECGAANLAIKKKVLLDVSCFDEGNSYGEDIDLTWRLQEAGYKIIFRSNMTIFHDWGTFHEDLRRSFRYGTSRTNLYLKYPYRWRNLFNQDINMLLYPSFIILAPLAIWYPAYLLLILIPILKNANNHPLKTTVLHFVYGAGTINGLFRGVK